MIVEKVLNNNVVVSIDPNTRKEVILMGSGIAFNKKPGQLIDDKKMKKSIDRYKLRWYSNTCPWDKGKTTWKKLKKTLKKVVDKEKKLWYNKEAWLRTLKIKQ